MNPRGRPFEPGNQFGRGRPRGGRNKKTAAAEKLFEDNSPALMAMALNKSREDSQILKMLINRMPRRKDAPAKIGSLPVETLDDMDRASKIVIKKALAGKISWSEAAAASGVIEDRRKLLETRDFERRIRNLENPGKPPPIPPVNSEKEQEK